MKKVDASAKKQTHKWTDKQKPYFFLVIPDISFLNLVGYVHQRTEIIMKLYQKVLLNLCII